MSAINSKHFTLEKVSPNTYAAIAKKGSGSVANAGIIDLGDKSIIFDTFNTQQASHDLKEVAEKLTNKPVTYVINSHWHGDHIRGNQSFKESTIMASEITQTKMRELHPGRIRKQQNDIQGLKSYIQSLERQLNENHDNNLKDQIHFLREIEFSLPKLQLVLPNKTFKDEFTFSGTKCSAKLFTFGGGHSYCDSMLYIPEEGVIFMGDLLFGNCHPSFFPESDLDKWIEILKQVEGYDFKVAVPGHGSIGTMDDISNLISYIRDLMFSAKEVDPDNLENIAIPKQYKNWNSPEIFYQNIKLLKDLQ